MSECPYLKYVVKSCTSCSGYVCRAYGREKKLSDTSQCKGDYAECLRYLDLNPKTPESLVEPKIFTASNTDPAETTVFTVTPTVSTHIPPPRQLFAKNPCGCGEEIRLSDCPYQSTNLPEGRKSCTGIWCYGDNKSIRVPKTCRNFPICTVYLMGKYKGVPFPK